MLDPHLEYIVSHLLHALGGVIRCSLHYPTTSDIDANVQPLPRAVCKLVYTLCKVRGAKVITRFFDNDTRYIGRLSGILETWKESLSWEERYVILLWLSHLALTPFDLDSLSTSSETIIPAPERTVISPDPLPLPEVAERLMSLARQYFSSVSKEREVATLLLVRLSLRPDMQRLCLHKHCIDWALLTLVQSGTESVNKSIHICISLLSFLAALFKSGDSMSVGQFVLPVLASLQKTLRNSNSSTKLLHESAIARKLFVKVECALASHLLSGSSFVDNQTDDLNQLMDHLLSLLQDKEGSVRLAASKALSVIAQRLDTDMRTQLLEEIIARYHESANLTLSEGHNAHPKTYLELHRHLASVDALQWHGLTLTLAHFLYRHCVPPKKLTAVINLVLCALDFEQRSATGKSTGANVRDAACFGLWSLARKYNTRELLRVASSQVRKRSTLFVHTSIFDIIAPDLLVRAGFDPDGNIRRAASAALQELVGRHPDLVPKGIELIQLVDYNSVGSRRQAIFQVVSLAAKLHHLYLCAICEGLFSWGGIYSPDLETRRVMAAYAGETVAQCPQPIIAPLQHHFESSHKRSVEEWHGLYLTLAAAVKFNPPTAIYGQFILSASLTISDLPYLLQENAGLSETDLVASNRSPEIAAEAVCCMIAASAYIIAGGSFQTWEDVSYHVRLLHASLGHCDKVPTYVYEQAALSILAAIDPDMKFGLVEEWLKNIDNGHGGRVQSGESNVGWITVVGVSLAAWIYVVPPMPYDSVLVKLLSKESDIDSKIAALRYLYGPVYNYCKLRPSLRAAYNRTEIRSGYGFSLNLEHLKQSLINSLDDYTVDSRGDIGSNVRIAALEIFGKLEVLNALAPDFKEILLGMISGLRLEKMDRVRDHASQCRRIQIKRSYDRVMGPA